MPQSSNDASEHSVTMCLIMCPSHLLCNRQLLFLLLGRSVVIRNLHMLSPGSPGVTAWCCCHQHQLLPMLLMLSWVPCCCCCCQRYRRMAPVDNECHTWRQRHVGCKVRTNSTCMAHACFCRGNACVTSHNRRFLCHITVLEHSYNKPKMHIGNYKGHVNSVS